MSGIYLVVYDEQNGHQSNVLRPVGTKYPHITLAYTGRNLDRESLAQVAKYALVDAVLRPIHIVKAYVNSFQLESGEERHDVLLALSKEDEMYIERCRDVYLRSTFPNTHTFSMNTPHITHGIFTNLAAAQEACSNFNQNVALPYQVQIKGVTL